MSKPCFSRLGCSSPPTAIDFLVRSGSRAPRVRPQHADSRFAGVSAHPRPTGVGHHNMLISVSGMPAKKQATKQTKKQPKKQTKKQATKTNKNTITKASNKASNKANIKASKKAGNTTSTQTTPNGQKNKQSNQQSSQNHFGSCGGLREAT